MAEQYLTGPAARRPGGPGPAGRGDSSPAAGLRRGRGGGQAFRADPVASAAGGPRRARFFVPLRHGARGPRRASLTGDNHDGRGRARRDSDTESTRKTRTPPRKDSDTDSERMRPGHGKARAVRVGPTGSDAPRLRLVSHRRASTAANLNHASDGFRVRVSACRLAIDLGARARRDTGTAVPSETVGGQRVRARRARPGTRRPGGRTVPGLGRRPGGTARCGVGSASAQNVTRVPRRLVFPARTQTQARTGLSTGGGGGGDMARGAGVNGGLGGVYEWMWRGCAGGRGRARTGWRRAASPAGRPRSSRAAGPP